MITNCSIDFWKGRRVWLSGHTGFKGSWLALWLMHWGAVVEGYGLDPDDQEGPSLFESLEIASDFAQDVRSDLANAAYLKERIKAFQPEIVFHLAAQPLVRRSYQDPLLTWNTNVIGTCNVLEALREVDHQVAAVIVTTDKVYQNCSWDYGYREEDLLGGHDPYSSSKAAAEIAIASWRSSFCGEMPHQRPNLRIASARAGNVIGGGDWAKDRIVPDVIRSLIEGKPIPVRAPRSTRPWQHVLEPLHGYLKLAQNLYLNPSLATAFNFGPNRASNKTVQELVEEILSHWPGTWIDQSDSVSVHEALRLDLSTDKAFHQLDWTPRWSFEVTISQTVEWYRRFNSRELSRSLCIEQIDRYLKS